MSARARGSLSYRAVSPALAIAPTVSVIIPARNEAANLPHVFGTLPPWIDEIVLVDGHSVGDTVAVTRALCPKAEEITQPGRGNGDALHAGFAAAADDILVVIDAAFFGGVFAVVVPDNMSPACHGRNLSARPTSVRHREHAEGASAAVAPGTQAMGQSMGSWLGGECDGHRQTGPDGARYGLAVLAELSCPEHRTARG